jgi:hypothetical protein
MKMSGIAVDDAEALLERFGVRFLLGRANMHEAGHGSHDRFCSAPRLSQRVHGDFVVEARRFGGNAKGACTDRVVTGLD